MMNQLRYFNTSITSRSTYIELEQNCETRGCSTIYKVGTNVYRLIYQQLSTLVIISLACKMIDFVENDYTGDAKRVKEMQHAWLLILVYGLGQSIIE
jgi:hypothetical protein